MDMWKLTASTALCSLLLTATTAARADEGGVSFWLPGNFGSLAATPGTPGWSWVTIYYHGDAAAGANAPFPRGGRTDVGISGRGDLAFFGPTYTFATPVLGGQAAISILGAAGRNEASAALSLTGPLGNTIALSRTQELTSFGDVIPSATLKWNFGTSNLMVYGMGDVPIGDYDPARLANLGIGHAAADFGGGYTYFDPKSGNEFSWVAGLTYNFKNPDTQYRNGADFHIDWGASHFFDSKLQLGLVGVISSRYSTTSARRRLSAASAPASPGSVRSSATSFQWATSCRDTST